LYLPFETSKRAACYAVKINDYLYTEVLSLLAQVNQKLKAAMIPCLLKVESYNQEIEVTILRTRQAVFFEKNDDQKQHSSWHAIEKEFTNDGK
jgi:hypothetical protein